MYYGSGLADGWLNGGSIGSGVIGSGQISTHYVTRPAHGEHKPYAVHNTCYNGLHKNCVSCGKEYNGDGAQVIIFHHGRLSGGPQSYYCERCAGYSNVGGFKSRKVADEKPVWKTFR